MIPEDFLGDKNDTGDCPGYRAFKRAARENLPWHKRLFMSYRWMYVRSCSGKWKAFKNGSAIDMMRHTREGDIITFKKKFKR